MTDPATTGSTADIDDLTDLLARLVGFPTESRSPNADLIDYYAGRAARSGGVCRSVPGPEGRSNLHIRFGPDRSGGILLSGHTDVVPAGRGWSTDPYRLTAVDGRLHGRGTADMKGFLAVALLVIEQCDTNRLNHPVHVALSYDEEVGCVGVRRLLTELAADPSCRPDLVAVGEPTELRLCTAHTGKVVYRVEITSPSGHSSRSPLQPTAISVAGDIIAMLTALNTRAASETAAQSPPFSTNVGTITGGVAVNVLAPGCVFDFECRHQKAVDPGELLDPLFDAVATWRAGLGHIGGDISVQEELSYPALDTSLDDAAVRNLHDALGGTAPGRRLLRLRGGVVRRHTSRPGGSFRTGQHRRCPPARRVRDHRRSSSGPPAVGRRGGAILLCPMRRP